jgi:glycine cleavage system aminomethyltransferase T
MGESAGGTLKQTPLNTVHRRLGARMVDFGGWDMPVNTKPCDEPLEFLT